MDGYISNALRMVSSPASLPPRRLRTDMAGMAADALIVWDILSVAGAGCLSALACSRGLAGPAAGFFAGASHLSLLGGLLAVFVLHGAPSEQYRSPAAVAGGTAGRVALLLGLLLAVLGLTGSGGDLPRPWLALWAAAILVVAVGGRLALLLWLRALAARGVLRERVAVIGHGPAAARLVAQLHRQGGPVIELAGVFTDGPDRQRVSTDCARLIELGQRNELDWVILAAPDAAGERLGHIVHHLKALDVQVALCPDIAKLPVAATELCQFGGLPMVRLVRRPIDRRGRLAKAAIDKAVSAAALLALAPLLLLVAAAIRCDSPGPALFRQRRHGRNNTTFEVLKFRTMRMAPRENCDGHQQTQRHDRRVTRLGNFLRHSSIDELPQLWNVLRGEMSLVGPRPLPCEMRTCDRLSRELAPLYAHRHRVKPGITGWAQVNGHRGALQDAEQLRARIDYDLHYIDHWSLLLDLKILLLTPAKLIFNGGKAF